MTAKMAKSTGYLSRATKVKRGPEEIQPAPNIAAIDFGSSCVSVAYSIEGKKDIHTLKLHRDYERVPNAILIRKEDDGVVELGQNVAMMKKADNHRVVEFGQNAQEKYNRMTSSQRDNFIYFERIKILLERTDAVHRMVTVWSHTGGSYYLVEVIAFIIKYLKEQLLKNLPEQNKYKSSDFDWVITVPAIWKASAKRMMREAAYMAGLTSDDYPSIAAFTPVGNEILCPPEINPDKLILALEPEVAAIYTQSEVRELAGRVPPQRYMVVDIGGGTVDITVHDQRDGKIDVLTPPTGNMWGGITVNQAFEHLLEETFKDDGFEEYSKNNPDDAIKNLVHVEFENEKKLFGDNADSNFKSYLTIPLPLQVVKFYKDKNIKKRVKSMQVEYENDTIIFEYDKVRQIMFQPTVDSILECVMSTLRGLPSKVDTIYIVGGFGGCEFMYSAIHSALTKHKGTHFDSIVRPHLPDLAVVKGAVMWRQDPSIIQSRRADATYGISVGIMLDPSIHDMHYRYQDEDGNLRCRNVFKVFIDKGEITEINDIYTTEIIPLHQANTQLSTPIYSTENVGVQYTCDKSGQWTVKEIGQIVIDIPNPDNKPNQERKVEISMSFSGTEIHAKAKYCITGEEVKTVCDFLTHQD